VTVFKERQIKRATPISPDGGVELSGLELRELDPLRKYTPYG